MSGKKREVHVSHLGTFLKCGMQYKFRYIEGRRVPPGIAILIGKATHTTIESNYRRKIFTKALMSADEVADVARDQIVRNLDQEFTVDDEDMKAAGNVEVIKGKAIDTTVDLSLIHHHNIAWIIDPFKVEHGWALELGGFPYDLAGWIDVIAIEQNASGQQIFVVRDNKTSAKRKQQKEANESLQLTGYSLGVKTEMGLDYYPPVALDTLVHTKKQEYHDILRSIRNDADRDLLFRHLEHFAESVAKDVFKPADPNHWVCSGRWCGYWNDICPFGRRNRISITVKG